MNIAVPQDKPWASGAQVAGILLAAGHETYFVGGCVRDLLLHRPVHDVDLATAADPDTVEAVGQVAGLKTIAVGKSFGVVVVVAPDGQHVEVATFRSDSAYVDGRRPSAVSFSDARTDVERRDFTVNALLLDPRDGRIVDHVGGLDDLQSRTLRAVGDAAARLREDRLRVLRGLRFAAHLGFTIEPATWRALCATSITGLSGERLMQEWDKALGDAGAGRWLRFVADSGRLGELCPPLVETDVDAAAEHLGRLLAGDDPALRSAVCLARAPWPAVKAWLEAQPLAGDRVKRITWLLTTDPVVLAEGPAATRWRTLRAGWPGDLIRLTACCAPQHPLLPTLAAWAADPRADRAWKPHLKASDLLGLGYTPGPALGRALAALEDLELAGQIATRSEALDAANRLRSAPP